MSETTPRSQVPYGIPPPVFHLPHMTHIGAAHLQVVELQRSMSYYTQVLGLRAHSTTHTSTVLSAVGDEGPLVKTASGMVVENSWGTRVHIQSTG